jgi:predicted transcriptional regulator
MSTPKREALDLIERLPEEVSWETMIEEMAFKARVLEGIADADAGRLVSHDEVKKELQEWLKSIGR